MAVKSITRFGIQRKIVANMCTESWQNIPHVSYQYEPDVTKFMEAFKAFQAEHNSDEGPKITFNAVLLKAIAEAIDTTQSKISFTKLFFFFGSFKYNG